MFSYFGTMEPMKYYDCGGDFSKQNAKAMLGNLNNDYIATQKFDGEWCRLIKWNNQIVAQSRSISKVTGQYGDKTELIPHIIAEFDEMPDGTVLIGELCWRDVTKTSKDVGTILRCKAPKAIERQKNEKLIYRVFDCLAWGGTSLMDKNFGERFEYAKFATTCTNLPFTYILPPIYTEDNFEDFLQEILIDGGEGIVIHSKKYIYSPGKRPAWTTLKVKKITTELELQVVQFIEPNKSYEGTEIDNWKFWIDDKPVTKPYYYGWKNGVVVDHNGTLVRVTSGLTDDDRAWLAEDETKDLLLNGSIMAVVSAMEVDKESGSLRHPRLVRLRIDI